MRKKPTKLTLNRETVRSLAEDAVRTAVGRDDQTWATCAECTRISYCNLCMPWE